MEEVPRRTSLVPLAFPCFLHRLIGVETEGFLDYQGRVGDHFHCAVEPSPGHIRCRKNGLFGHFNGLLGRFFRGVQNGIFRTLKCTFGVSGFRGSVAGRGVCKIRNQEDHCDFPKDPAVLAVLAVLSSPEL